MNGYELIMKIQQKMRDPVFEQKFNAMVSEFNNIPGLQQEVMRIAQISDERKRQKQIDRLPDKAKKLVRELFSLLNN